MFCSVENTLVNIEKNLAVPLKNYFYEKVLVLLRVEVTSYVRVQDQISTPRDPSVFKTVTLPRESVKINGHLFTKLLGCY